MTPWRHCAASKAEGWKRCQARTRPWMPTDTFLIYSWGVYILDVLMILGVYISTSIYISVYIICIYYQEYINNIYIYTDYDWCVHDIMYIHYIYINIYIHKLYILFYIPIYLIYPSYKLRSKKEPGTSRNLPQNRNHWFQVRLGTKVRTSTPEGWKRFFFQGLDGSLWPKIDKKIVRARI